MSITPENAMTQASMTAATYMDQAIKDIDKAFGEGYAKENPRLLLGISQIAAADFELTFKMGVIDLPYEGP